MRGGWQMPYFADNLQVNKPSKNGTGVVILPHVTWDWIASFTESHELNTHMLNLKSFFEGNITLAKGYFFDLIDSTLCSSKPFGFVSVQFEWCWTVLDGNLTEYAQDWVKELLQKKDYIFCGYGAFTDWFNRNYALTPEYEVNFISPYSGEKIEWFFNVEKRVARTENRVVSFVDYEDQSPDEFLTKSAVFDMNYPSSTLNCVDNSLKFTIDALGGGICRAPLATESFPYDGKLKEFVSFSTTYVIAP